MVTAGKRAEDQSFWWRTTTALEKYKLLVWVALAALIAFGFDFQTPASALRAATTRVSAVEGRISAVEGAQVNMSSEIGKITRLQCFNTSYSRRELDLVGIDCSFTDSTGMRKRND